MYEYHSGIGFDAPHGYWKINWLPFFSLLFDFRSTKILTRTSPLDTNLKLAPPTQQATSTLPENPSLGPTPSKYKFLGFGRGVVPGLGTLSCRLGQETSQKIYSTEATTYLSPNLQNVQERVRSPLPPLGPRGHAKGKVEAHHFSPNSIVPAPKSKLKSSVQRGLRSTFLETYPLLEPYIDGIFPKKADLSQMKLPDRASLYILDNDPLFFQADNSPLIPHLKLVHRFPQCFPSVRIDRGAIRFVLSGATLMAPGLTSKGGRLPEDRGDDKEVDGRWGREVDKGRVVVIKAEGKEEACAVGVLVMGTKDVKEKGKGPVVQDAHILGDSLWRMNTD